MSTWIRDLVFAGAALAAVAACGKSGTATSAGSASRAAGSSTSATAGSASPSASPSATTSVAKVVEIFVDNQSVARVAEAQLASWPRLDTLVPVAARRMGTWDDVFVQGSGPKPAQLHRPTDQHPDLVPALFPGADGSASFGMFDPVELAKHGSPQIREDHVVTIHLALAKNSGRGEHEQGQGGGSDPAALVIEITTPKGKSQLLGKTLLAIPRVPMPGETAPARGWTLQTLLDAAGIKHFDKLLLTDSAGLNLTLEKRDFDPKSSVPFVKLNRQGALRFQVFEKHGDGWKRGGDLRGLVSIEVLK